ncbi:MAG: carbonic anhydrase [Planctomycetia bacterium]|nr:carbonic anhydrase [Planctomycetia bacterium]
MSDTKINSGGRTPSGRVIPARVLLGVFAAAVASLAFAPAVEDESPKTPDQALAKLMSGNQRFVEMKAKAGDKKIDRDELAAGQAPFAAVIRCADSRVAPEICFDQPLGSLFVCAVAGNIPTSEGIASLEFGVAVLGTKLIVVMGHSGCGAVDAAIKHRDDTSVLPGSLPGLINQIVSPCALSVDPKDPEALAKATRCNANLGVTELLKESPVIREAVQNGKLRVVAGVQDLATGRFTLTRE